MFKEIFRIVDGLRRSGQTILMVEQNAAKALEISEALEGGESACSGA
ncbi:MAG: hypothetical protein ACREM3_15680 [Candidatus Rokuibacteriota bacterium]